MYVVSDHDFDADAPTVEREKWFNAPFTKSSVDEQKLAAWETSEPDVALQYPPKNVYIAEKFDIKAGSSLRLAEAIASGSVPSDATVPPPAPLVSPPEIIHECGLMRLWHRADDKFDQPRMNAYFHVNLSSVENTPLAFVHADMLTLMVHDQLQNSTRYPAELASLNAGLDSTLVCPSPSTGSTTSSRNWSRRTSLRFPSSSCAPTASKRSRKRG